jgi:hypothetical protein
MLHDNPPIETLDGLEFFPPLNDACQTSTVYRGERPVGTLIRKRVMERNKPTWVLYATDGTKLREFWLAPTYERLAHLTSHLISKYLGE